MRYRLVTFLTLGATAMTPAAAQLRERWVDVFPVANDALDAHAGSVVLGDGSVVVAGTRSSPAPGITDDVVMARCADDGTVLWVRSFAPAGGFDSAASLALDPATDDVLLVGSTRSPGAADLDLRVSRFDASGQLVWSVTHATPEDELGDLVCVAGSGGIWVAGRSRDLAAPFVETPFLLGLTSTGVEFSATTSTRRVVGMQAHPAGGVAVARAGYVLGSGGQLRTTRVDDAGNELWTRIRGNDASAVSGSLGNRLSCDAAGNVFVCGAVSQPVGAEQDGAIVAYDAGGALLWSRSYDDGSHADQGLTAIAIDAQGEIAAVGTMLDASADTLATFLVRCRPDGTASWYRSWDPIPLGLDARSDVAFDGAGDLWVAGSSLASTAPLVWHGELRRYDRYGTLRASSEHVAPTGGSSRFAQCHATHAGPNGGALVSGIGGGLLVARVDVEGGPFCLGDGVAAACPCGNTSSVGNGCANSVFAEGASLDAEGVAALSSDTFTLAANHLTGSIALFFQGASVLAPTVVDDGLGCIGGPVVRLGVKPASTSSAYPMPGDPPISVRGAIPPAGGTFYYQCFYRNAAAAFCPPATSNRTSGWWVLWAP